jgi:putative alpha-1,2-mannosidase
MLSIVLMFLRATVRRVAMIRAILMELALMGIWHAGSVFGAAQPRIEPVDYVNPNIGGIGQLLTATLPAVQYPYGMASVVPITTPGIRDHYLADKIFGFSAGPALIMASTAPSGASADQYASDFDHDFEVSTPYYYEADLLTWGIKAECTTTAEAAYYRFTFPANGRAHLLLSLQKDASIEVIGNSTLAGSASVDAPIGKPAAGTPETRAYFYAEFSSPFGSWQIVSDG